MTRKLRAVGVLVAIVAAAVVMFRGVFALMDLGGDRAGRAGSSRVIIGSKADTEGLILGEILAQWLERRAGVEVVRRFSLGGTNLCFEALRTGAIDLYPEYTGTGLTAILQRPPMSDRAAVYRTVHDTFEQRYGLEWLAPFGFNNTYALAVRSQLARDDGLARISDLVPHHELTAGFTAEFLARDDGWPGLQARYGLAFDQAPRSMEAGLMYQAAASGQVDVISAYSTDGRIATMHLVVLDDDRHFFPPYEAAPLVRRDLLARRPAVRAALMQLGGRIDEDTIRRMNAAVDSGRDTPAHVARLFLDTLPH